MIATQQAVFLVDDDPDLRRALGRLIQVSGREVETYSTAGDFLERYETTLSGCIVLDIQMPGMNGLELQQELNRRHAELPIIFITGHADVPMAVQALRDGAFDFITKPFEHQDLLNRIEQAFERNAEKQDEITRAHEVRGNYKTLTARESEVMSLVVEGLANKVIANRLGVSQRTVEVHRARVMAKMNADSLAELVRMAMLLDDDDDPEASEEEA